MQQCHASLESTTVKYKRLFVSRFTACTGTKICCCYFFFFRKKILLVNMGQLWSNSEGVTCSKDTALETAWKICKIQNQMCIGFFFITFCYIYMIHKTHMHHVHIFLFHLSNSKCNGNLIYISKEVKLTYQQRFSNS